MAGTKIAVIGAASSTFGPKLLRDLAHFKELAGSRLSLMDVDPARLAVYARLARRVSQAAGVDYAVEETTDRRRALDGADFVMLSFSVRRNELWEQDLTVPRKHGVQHVTAECGGPGGLMHTLRNVPIVLDVARDVEQLCPRAPVLVISNPEARLTLALQRHTAVRAVGLCHGVEIILQPIARLLGTPADDLEVTAAGTNHFTWILDLRHRATGADVYPLLRQKLDAPHADRQGFHPLSRKLWEVFGLFPSPGDSHIGEFLPYGWEYCGDGAGPDFGALRERSRVSWEYLARQADGGAPIDEYLRGRTWADTLAFPIIDGIVNDRGRRMPALNLPNDGYVTNLPAGAIVEVPAIVDAAGIRGVPVGALPQGIAALCKREIEIQELAVAAAVSGDRRLALQALLIDPVIRSVAAAERTLDELLELQAPYLPRFQVRARPNGPRAHG